MSMAGKRVEVLVTVTIDLGKILTAIQNINLSKHYKLYVNYFIKVVNVILLLH